MKLSVGAWLVWGAVAFFLVNLLGLVASVVVNSFSVTWFDTWWPSGLTADYYRTAWQELALLDVLVVTLQVSAADRKSVV